MNKLETIDLPARLILRRRLAVWSDGIVPQAVRFVEQYRDLLPRRITNSQLSGLENVVGQSTTYKEIRAFLDNRADRANRAGRLDVAAYWNALIEALNDLKDEAEQLGKTMCIGLDDRQRKALVDELHVWLVREYVQHMVAHSLFVTEEQN